MSEETGLYDFELESSLTGKDRELNYRRMAFLLSTLKGTLPGDRGFGLEGEFLGKLSEVAHALYAADVFAQAKKYVPEVKVYKIEWNCGTDGKAKPKVVIMDA